MKNTNFTLFSSENCYKGQDKNEIWEFGSYSELYDNPKINNDIISWCQLSWDDEMDYFKEFLNSLKDSFEKRYRTTVQELAIVGSLGRWNGRVVAGKIGNFDNPISGSWDDIAVKADDNGYLYIEGQHHDGTDRVYFYFLTDSSMKRAGIFGEYDMYGADGFGADEFEKIDASLNPVKIPNKNSYYQKVKKESVAV